MPDPRDPALHHLSPAAEPTVTDLDEPVDLAQMLATGATYRQLDHWTGVGWILDHGGDPLGLDSMPGSGYRRKWNERDRRIAAYMVRLIGAGIQASTAARLARGAVDRGQVSETRNGVTITWIGVGAPL